MEAELKALEEKIAQIVHLCQHLREENVQLRQQLATALNDNKQLNDKVSGAAQRLETLLETLPEAAQ